MQDVSSLNESRYYHSLQKDVTIKLISFEFSLSKDALCRIFLFQLQYYVYIFEVNKPLKLVFD